GVAIHIGPESCAGAREGIREALTGECTGQPSSRERNNSRAPTQSSTRKATRTGAQFASARTARRGQRPWHAQTLFAREPGDLTSDRSVCTAGPHGDGRFTRLFHILVKADLLILDDWGPDRLTANQRRDLMEIVEDRYG